MLSFQLIKNISEKFRLKPAEYTGCPVVLSSLTAYTHLNLDCAKEDSAASGVMVLA